MSNRSACWRGNALQWKEYIAIAIAKLLSCGTVFGNCIQRKIACFFNFLNARLLFRSIYAWFAPSFVKRHDGQSVVMVPAPINP
jgi:hypothetical protein